MVASVRSVFDDPQDGDLLEADDLVAMETWPSTAGPSCATSALLAALTAHLHPSQHKCAWGCSQLWWRASEGASSIWKSRR